MTTSYYAREDNNNANNPALNLNNDPAVELIFVPDGGSGDVILEANGGAPDPDTLVEIGGVQYSFTYEFAGTMPTTQSDGAQQVPDQYEGSDVVLVTVQDYPTTGDTTRFAFMPNENATQADMDSFGNGAIDVQAVNTSPPPTPVCFLKGTLIATPDGERRVEDLQAGDLVLNGAGQARELLWVASSRYSHSDLVFQPDARPVCIPRNYLGRGMPHSDLWVSPQHRVVVQGWKAELYTGHEAVFVPAKHLVGVPGLPGARWKDGVDYYHLLLERHEVVVSNGLRTERLYPGKEALKSMGRRARADLERLRPDLRSPARVRRRTALTTLSAHEAELFRPALNRAA